MKQSVSDIVKEVQEYEKKFKNTSDSARFVSNAVKQRCRQ